MADTVDRYLARQWPNGMPCPLCGEKKWFWPPDGPRALEGLGDAMDPDQEIPALPVSFYLLICEKCGFIVPILEQAVVGQDE